ncbi:MAG: bifunctional UDP-3-O-[3-hydroxymyristoyl] N-acetylglucosamine deacetylase/3-hydroxyacyl-ACP dehydratase, partial [Bacteroidota bacterium]
KSVSVSGVGLHTGTKSIINFMPAPVNHGYRFQRTDLEGKPVISAIVENVTDTSRGTTIEENGVKIGTIEHLLAACYGLGIDNVLIEINAPEVPIMDGSAWEFVKVLSETGIVDQEEDRKVYPIREKVSFGNIENGVSITLYPDDAFSVNVMIDYQAGYIANQFAQLDNLTEFKEHFSRSRTFVFLHELEFLLKNNLIKGGDLDNAIVIMDRVVEQEEIDRLSALFNKPKVKVLPESGILNNIDLHYKNEPARHKLTDLLGDLALIGYRFTGKILATRPGHLSNVEFAKLIKQIIKKERSKNKAPVFNLNTPPLLDINQIMKLLPHRPPFLLVDKVIEMNETSVIGVKNVTMNEAFFVGHFPEEPVMPGVLQIEAMAQVCAILGLNSIPDPESYSTYFMKIDNVKFKRKVVPGDTLIFQVELKEPIRRGVAVMIGKAFVGDTLVMEGELMAQLTKNK